MNKVLKYYYQHYNEPIYTSKLFHNLHLLGADFPIFPDGASGNSSFLYYLLKYLFIKKPKKILELGVGQSSYINNLYLKKNPHSKCLSVENDEQWFQLLSKRLESRNHFFKHLLLKNQELLFNKKKMNIQFYDLGFLKEKFNLIILDGPFGGLNRFGFIQYLDTIIDKDDFILIIDDTNRKMDQKLADIIEEKLRNDLKFDITSFSIKAMKHQRIILSPTNKYLLTV